jgi:NAD+ kinase
MKSAAVVSKPSKPELQRIAPELLRWFRAHGYEVWLDRETAVYAPGFAVVDREEIASKRPDFVVVLGGDGTLLSAARAVALAGIPILGVNLGSLGFLTEVPLDELYPTLEALDADRCAVESRSMLHCNLMRGETLLAHYDALNDAVVNKAAIARLASFDLIVDGNFVTNYKADGLIVSTPTGSTAYSLAASGPILMPDADTFVITPVCPHSLTHRPLVVRDSAHIEVLIKCTDEEVFLSIDGQVGMPVRDQDRLTCRKSEHQVKLLRLSDRNFFDVLRAKLKWGQR